MDFVGWGLKGTTSPKASLTVAFLVFTFFVAASQGKHLFDKYLNIMT